MCVSVTKYKYQLGFVSLFKQAGYWSQFEFEYNDTLLMFRSIHSAKNPSRNSNELKNIGIFRLIKGFTLYKVRSYASTYK